MAVSNFWATVFILCSWTFSGSMSSDKPPNPSNKKSPQEVQSPMQQNNLFWNTSNPIFRIDNTDHIIDVIHGRRLNIICPHYARSIPPGDTEQFIIYAVNKEEYDTCRIMTASPRIVAKCDTPFIRKFFTISFRSFSPMPNAMQFFPGEDYYFISTSTKDDLFLRVEGMCRSNNMRAVFKVQDMASVRAKQAKAAEAAAAAAAAAKEPNLQANSVAVNTREKPERLDDRPRPKTFDYFLHQTKEKMLLNDMEQTSGSKFHKDAQPIPNNNSKRDKTLFKQEASTSGASPVSANTNCYHVKFVNGSLYSHLLHVLSVAVILPFLWSWQGIKFELNST